MKRTLTGRIRLPRQVKTQKDAPSCALAETEHSLFTDDERVMHDKDFARGQGFNFGQRYPVPEAFRQIAAVPIEAPELHGLDEILFCICKSNAVAST
jgi:hypothetical protein